MRGDIDVGGADIDAAQVIVKFRTDSPLLAAGSADAQSKSITRQVFRTPGTACQS